MKMQLPQGSSTSHARSSRRIEGATISTKDDAGVHAFSSAYDSYSSVQFGAGTEVHDNTPTLSAVRMHTLRQGGPMAAIRSRARRPEGSLTVLLQARVAPDARAAVQAAAGRSGVSIAYYMEALIFQLSDDNGDLPVVVSPRSQREELPIPAA